MKEKNSIDIDYFLLSIACKKFNSNSGVHFWTFCRHSDKAWSTKTDLVSMQFYYIVQTKYELSNSSNNRR